MVGASALACVHRPPATPAAAVPSAPAAPAAVQSGVTRNGLSWEEEGQGDPVVLIHAFSLDRRMWDAQVAALKRHHRVLRYDLRAHGKSTAPLEPYAAYDDLEQLLEERGIAKAALVGLSNGARIALDFALVHPERVTRLVLASPGVSGYVPQEKMDWMTPVFAAARAGDAEKAATLWAETPLMALSDPAAAATVKRLALDNKALWLLTQNPERPLKPPALGRLGEIQVPVLILEGEKDLPDTHHAADALLAGIPTAQRIVVPGAGHMVNLAAPGVFEGAVGKFLLDRGSSQIPR